jgi:hypothetical protein
VLKNNSVQTIYILRSSQDLDVSFSSMSILTKVQLIQLTMIDMGFTKKRTKSQEDITKDEVPTKDNDRRATLGDVTG